MLERVQAEGLEQTFFAFQAWGVPSFQEEYLNLKPKLVEVFKKYEDGTGYLNVDGFKALAPVLVRGSALDAEAIRKSMDTNQDDRISWREFWQYFEDRVANSQAEVDEMYTKLTLWLRPEQEEEPETGSKDEGDGDANTNGADAEPAEASADTGETGETDEAAEVPSPTQPAPTLRNAILHCSLIPPLACCFSRQNQDEESLRLALAGSELQA